MLAAAERDHTGLASKAPSPMTAAGHKKKKKKKKGCH
jgi:hypothetical protein